MKSKETNGFLSCFLGQLHYILRIYVEPLTEVIDLTPSQVGIMFRLAVQQLRKEASLCLLVTDSKSFHCFESWVLHLLAQRDGTFLIYFEGLI